MVGAGSAAGREGWAGLQELTPARSRPYFVGACGGWEADGRKAQRRTRSLIWGEEGSWWRWVSE